MCTTSKEFNEHAWIPSLAYTVTICCNNKLELVLHSRTHCSNTPCMLACYWRAKWDWLSNGKAPSFANFDFCLVGVQIRDMKSLINLAHWSNTTLPGIMFTEWRCLVSASNLLVFFHPHPDEGFPRQISLIAWCSNVFCFSQPTHWNSSVDITAAEHMNKVRITKG